MRWWVHAGAFVTGVVLGGASVLLSGAAVLAPEHNGTTVGFSRQAAVALPLPQAQRPLGRTLPVSDASAQYTPAHAPAAAGQQYNERPSLATVRAERRLVTQAACLSGSWQVTNIQDYLSRLLARSGAGQVQSVTGNLVLTFSGGRFTEEVQDIVAIVTTRTGDTMELRMTGTVAGLVSMDGGGVVSFTTDTVDVTDMVFFNGELFGSGLIDVPLAPAASATVSCPGSEIVLVWQLSDGPLPEWRLSPR